MVKFSTIALFFITSAISVQAACTYCQCQYRGGQPCCVTPTKEETDVTIDCHALCETAYKYDGTWHYEGGKVVEGTRCNGGGNYKCITRVQMEASPVQCVQPSGTRLVV
ncbi:hypothetical protein NHQ30_011383 [Ciborinia camelliae]|nr:hypothetical protein NHQ30_011383 [Ciborinia camelliae]